MSEGELKICQNPGCTEPVRPLHGRGRPRKFCSDECRLYVNMERFFQRLHISSSEYSLLAKLRIAARTTKNLLERFFEALETPIEFDELEQLMRQMETHFSKQVRVMDAVERLTWRKLEELRHEEQLHYFVLYLFEDPSCVEEMRHHEAVYLAIRELVVDDFLRLNESEREKLVASTRQECENRTQGRRRIERRWPEHHQKWFDLKLRTKRARLDMMLLLQCLKHPSHCSETPRTVNPPKPSSEEEM